MKRLLMGCAGIMLWAGQAGAQQGPIMQLGGEVETSDGVPIPGCEVQLFNPDLGPSTAVETDGNGDYYFSQVPSNVRSLYDIQVRWGTMTIFNGVINHAGVQQPIVIALPGD